LLRRRNSQSSAGSLTESSLHPAFFTLSFLHAISLLRSVSRPNSDTRAPFAVRPAIPYI
jgi:hypothetical protein